MAAPLFVAGFNKNGPKTDLKTALKRLQNGFKTDILFMKESTLDKCRRQNNEDQRFKEEKGRARIYQ